MNVSYLPLPFVVWLRGELALVGIPCVGATFLSCSGYDFSQQQCPVYEVVGEDERQLLSLMSLCFIYARPTCCENTCNAALLLLCQCVSWGRPPRNKIDFVIEREMLFVRFVDDTSAANKTFFQLNFMPMLSIHTQRIWLHREIAEGFDWWGSTHPRAALSRSLVSFVSSQLFRNVFSPSLHTACNVTAKHQREKIWLGFRCERVLAENNFLKCCFSRL